MTASDHDLARQVAAMRTELREMRRLLEQVAHAIQAARQPYGTPQQLPDGTRFLPGSGHLDDTRPLSPDAKAALAQLDAQEPT